MLRRMSSFFPSLTDTFGNVLLEALACGVPVAAYNVMGPKDVVANGSVGFLGDDLREAALAALELDRKRVAPMPSCSAGRPVRGGFATLSPRLTAFSMPRNFVTKQMIIAL